jgi:signal transduction histidine kinase
MSKPFIDHNDSLRSVLHELLERREEEKREAALTLHDEIGQDLALLSLQLSVLQKRGVENTTHVANVIPELKRIIAEAQRKVRDLEFKLYPKIVELSLTDAVKGLVDRLVNARGYVIEYECPAPIRCGSKQAMCVYRCVENLFGSEGLSQSARWAVRLEERHECIELSVTETGLSQTVDGSFDLNPLNREYIRSLRGRVSMSSCPPHRLEILLPVV